MLYPLSYEGARAQSSDKGFAWGGREWQAFTHVTRTPVLPAQEHTPRGSSITIDALSPAFRRRRDRIASSVYPGPVLRG